MTSFKKATMTYLYEQNARIIPRKILITKSSSKTSFWVQDHSIATHRMYSKLSCSAILWTRTDCRWRSVSCMAYSFYKYVRSFPAVAGPINRPTQCRLINRSNSVTTLLLRALKTTYKQSNNDLDSRAVFVPFNFQSSHDWQTHMSSQYYCQAFPVVVGTFMLTKFKIFWNMTPYELENIYRRFGWACSV